MTPEDVVNIARGLEGEEVDVTVRGRVRVYDSGTVGLVRVDGGMVRRLSDAGRSQPDLVFIRPAPVPIEADSVYIDGDGEAWRSEGVSADGTWLLWPVGRSGTARRASTIQGLRPAKVVPR